MHHVEIRAAIKERVIRRRGRLHFYDRLDPARTAHLVIDMQNVFVAPGAPIEVPAARDIVDQINETNAGLRALGVKIVWITHTNRRQGGGNDWAIYYDHVMTPEIAESVLDWFQPEHEGSQIWSKLDVRPDDVRITKCRYSPLVPGASSLERYLRSNGLENILISGTKTNVCCESTARDAMMMDFRTVMLSDSTAAQSDDEHRATLENMITQFADVMTGAQAISVLKGNPLNE